MQEAAVLRELARVECARLVDELLIASKTDFATLPETPDVVEETDPLPQSVGCPLATRGKRRSWPKPRE
jgi:hypothetical protein